MPRESGQCRGYQTGAMELDVNKEIVRLLQRRQARGRPYAVLAEATRAELFGPVPRPRGNPAPKPAATPCPTAAAVPAAVAPVPDTDVPATPVAELDLEALARRIESCRLCVLHEKRKQTVFGDGSPNARLLFIGEGPGRDEDEQGKPFVGAAGKLLDAMITAMQFRRQDVYIANIVKCRPPGNRNPSPEEAAACLPYLQRQIHLIAPEVIVLLGAVPLRFLLHRDGITKLHGQWFEVEGIPTMPTFHPAYLLRVSSRKREAWSDLQKVMRRLGKDPQNTRHPGRDGNEGRKPTPPRGAAEAPAPE